MSDIAVPNVSTAPEPHTITDLVAALHHRIVDVEAAAGTDNLRPQRGLDYVSTLDGAPEPPD
jgi:hypothetical protein